jgi:branched-chain amino acid transport system ATP-binding protein
VNEKHNGHTTQLEMQNVVAGYYEHDLVLKDVVLKARPQEVTVILGPNGSGKSTALRVLYGILTPRTGRVLLGEQDITEVAPHRRPELGMVFLPQGRSIFPELTVHENLEMGGWVLRHNQRQLQDAVEAMYERYPVLKDVRMKPAGDLSGGQQRILEFGRLLVSDPSIILIDEPSAGLAPTLVDEVYDEIARLKEERRTIVLVDQNVRPAVELAEYIYTLEFGCNHMEGRKDAFEEELEALIREWLRLSW